MFEMNIPLNFAFCGYQNNFEHVISLSICLNLITNYLRPEKKDLIVFVYSFVANFETIDCIINL